MILAVLPTEASQFHKFTFSECGGGSLPEVGWGNNDPQSLQYVEYGSDGRGAKQ